MVSFRSLKLFLTSITKIYKIIFSEWIFVAVTYYKPEFISKKKFKNLRILSHFRLYVSKNFSYSYRHNKPNINVHIPTTENTYEPFARFVVRFLLQFFAPRNDGALPRHGDQHRKWRLGVPISGFGLPISDKGYVACLCNVLVS